MTLKKTTNRHHVLHGMRVARAMRDLAARAENGEVIGVAVASWTGSRKTELGVVGVFEHAPHMAHYAVSKLQAALLQAGED